MHRALDGWILAGAPARNQPLARRREITGTTHNVRTMAVDRTHGVRRALDILSVYDLLGCGIIGMAGKNTTR